MILNAIRFKDVVECERIVVRAFTTPHEVTSFRASKLSDDFYQLKADFERRKTKLPTKDDFSRDPTKDLGAGGSIVIVIYIYKGVFFFFYKLIRITCSKWCSGHRK